MRNICGIGLLLLLTQCNVWKLNFVPIRSQNNSNAILTESVAEFMHVPLYVQGLKSGNVFLQILPGYPISEEDLSFNKSLGIKLLSSPNELQKAYMFSKQVDGLLVLGKNAEADGSSLSEHYINTGNFSISTDGTTSTVVRNMHITTAGYDDDFFLTLLNPIQFSKDSCWSSLKKTSTVLETFQLEGKQVQIVLPTYRLSMELFSLKVERPWFELKYMPSKRKNSGKAFIDEVIFVRNLKLENFSNSYAKIIISKNAAKRKSVEYSPREVISIPGMAIIGFVYRVL